MIISGRTDVCSPHAFMEKNIKKFAILKKMCNFVRDMVLVELAYFAEFQWNI